MSAMAWSKASTKETSICCLHFMAACMTAWCVFRACSYSCFFTHWQRQYSPTVVIMELLELDNGLANSRGSLLKLRDHGRIIKDYPQGTGQ